MSCETDVKYNQYIYSTYSPSEERQIKVLAEKYDLLISGGSDFHGANKPKIDLGTGMEKLFLPEDLLEPIRNSVLEVNSG